MTTTVKAIRIDEFGGPEKMHLVDVAVRRCHAVAEGRVAGLDRGHGVGELLLGEAAHGGDLATEGCQLLGERPNDMFRHLFRLSWRLSWRLCRRRPVSRCGR